MKRTKIQGITRDKVTKFLYEFRTNTVNAQEFYGKRKYKRQKILSSSRSVEIKYKWNGNLLDRKIISDFSLPINSWKLFL